jgi:predicted outer membrane repeat protein
MTALGWSGRSLRLRPRGPRSRIARPDVLTLESRIVPTHVFTINSFTDGVVANPGAGTALTSDGRITLRSAIMEENAEGGGGAVIIPAGSYTLSLTGSNEDAGATGDLDILAPLLVQGAGSGSVTINGNGDRIFDVRTNGDVTITGVTLTGGQADVGGALRSAGGSKLELDDIVLKGNTSTSNGGAIAAGTSHGSGQLIINGMLVQNNVSGGLGGGIYVDGITAIVSGLTVAGNSASGGGGLAVVDTQGTRLAAAQISRATFSGNSASGSGGAFEIQAGIVQVTDSTISLNSAAQGGGIDGSLGGSNDIIAGNTAPTSPDISGSFSSQGFNLIGDGTGDSGTFQSSDQVGTAAAPINPLLSTLVIHGGTLPVLIPVPGSPALGAGHAVNPTDERGFVRPDTGTDIGAVEAQTFTISAVTGAEHAPGGTAFGPIQAIVKEDGLPLPGAVVRFIAPDGGASGTFASSPTVLTDASGIATAPTFTANFAQGSYTVQAQASTSLPAVNFALTNDRALTDSLSVTVGPGPFQAGQPFQITVTALTPSGTRDDAYAGTVSFSTDAGAGGSLPNPTTFGPSDGGQKTFMVTLGAAGQHAIKVTDPNGPAGQVSVTVQTDSLSVTVGPGPFQVGQPFQVTVTALNPSGNRDDTYTGTVSFSTDAGAAATLPISTTFGPSDGGQKTFTVTLGALGTHTIKVTDPTGPAGQVSVTVTPVTNRFVITAPPSVTEGQPFTITIAAQDSHGNPLSTFTGTVTLSSDTTRTGLPATVTFTANDEGVMQISGVVLWPPGPHTITATATDGTVGSVSIGVIDLGPAGLILRPDQRAIQQGSSITLSVTFKNPDPLSTHTVDVKWGDGTETIQPLGAGVFQFQIAHTYGSSSPTGSDVGDVISVTVTDEAGVSTTGNANVFVTNVPPTLPPDGGIATGNAGGPFGQIIPFTDPGTDNWTAVANCGDGSGSQPVPVSGHTLDLNHVYATEGTFSVTVTLSDGNGGTATLTEQAVVFRAGTTGVQVVAVPPGDTETLNIPGAIITLSNLGGTTTAFLLAGVVNPATLKGLTGSPSADPTQLVSAYDIRVLTAGPDSVLTAQLTYPNGEPGANPSVQYFDTAAAAFAPVIGSTKVANSFVVNKAAHNVTFILGDTSTPTVASLGGTVFTLSIPAPTPATTSNNGNPSTVNTGTTPFLLASAAATSAALAGLETAPVSAPIPTTGLVSSSTLTIAVSAAEGLVRGGGDEPLAGRLVNTQTLSTVIEAAVEISDFLKEAFRMWLDQPAPMEAPAAMLPPPDLHTQIQLREVTADVAAKAVAAAPPVPASNDVVALAGPTLPAEEVVVATAESHPWWLTAAPVRAESSTGDDAIPVEHVPTTGERITAGLTALWIGGHALSAVAPERRRDEKEDWLPPQPDEQDEE